MLLSLHHRCILFTIIIQVIRCNNHIKDRYISDEGDIISDWGRVIGEGFIGEVSFNIECEGSTGKSDARPSSEQREELDQMYECVKCKLFLSTK